MLRELNMALVANVDAGIFDTPTRAFIPKLASFAEFSSAQNIMANHENQAKENILKKRREMSSGKRFTLKGKIVATTEELYRDLDACENATKDRRASSGHGRGRRAS